MNVSAPCENVERTQFSRGLGGGMKEPGFISPTTIPHTIWLTSFSQPSWDDSQLMDAGADTDWGQAQGPVGHGKQGWHRNLGRLNTKLHLALPHSLGRKPHQERGITFLGLRPETCGKNHPRDPLAEELTRADKATPLLSRRARVTFIGLSSLRVPLTTLRPNPWASKPLR